MAGLRISEQIARVAKYFVPPALRPRLRREYIYLIRTVRNFGEKRKLARYQREGGTYLNWYAERLDKGAEDPLGKCDTFEWMQSGKDDLDVAISLGLKPHHSLCEFGCGDFRAGSQFIQYLDDGNYAANDASGGRMRYGEKCLKQFLMW